MAPDSPEAGAGFNMEQYLAFYKGYGNYDGVLSRSDLIDRRIKTRNLPKALREEETKKWLLSVARDIEERLAKEVTQGQGPEMEFETSLVLADDLKPGREIVPLQTTELPNKGWSIWTGDTVWTVVAHHILDKQCTVLKYQKGNPKPTKQKINLAFSGSPGLFLTGRENHFPIHDHEQGKAITTYPLAMLATSPKIRI